MRRFIPTWLFCFLAAGSGLLVSVAAPGSVVNYSTCPGYPLVQCPAGWFEAPIPDNNINGVTVQLHVPSDGEDIITDLDAWFYLLHTWQGDLRVVLTSPAGTSVDLINRPGTPACGPNGFPADNFGVIDENFFLDEFVLDDSAPQPYNFPAVGCAGVHHVNGSWKPASALSAFIGESKVGTWRIFIQDLAAGDLGTLTVWGMTIRTEPLTPPVADISQPDDYACACANGPVIGSASDPDGTFTGYRLEWSVDSSGPWSQISTSGSPVSNGVLGNFPVGMPEGYSYVRLIATNAINMSSTFVRVIHQDRAFNNIAILEPEDGAILGGSVCLDRVVASDYCFASAALAYAPQGGPFTTFFNTTAPVQEFPAWNTTTLPDGNYTLRVSGTTTCGHTASDSVPVVIDNTAPVAQIESPDTCDVAAGIMQIRGTATDAHFGGWSLLINNTSGGWQTLATGTQPVTNGLLATLDTSTLTPCSYALRLIVVDSATVSCLGNNSAEYVTTFDYAGQGLVGDLNCDGSLSVGDIAGFVLALINPQQYEIQFPACSIDHADINGDNAVTVGDIGAFVALLTTG